MSQINQGIKGTALAALDKMVDKSKGLVRIVGPRKRASTTVGTVVEVEEANEDWRRAFLGRLRNATANILEDSGEERLAPEEGFEATLLRLIPMMVRMQNFTLELFAMDIPRPGGAEGEAIPGDQPSFASLRDPVSGDDLGALLPVIPDPKLQKRLQ